MRILLLALILGSAFIVPTIKVKETKGTSPIPDCYTIKKKSLTGELTSGSWEVDQLQHVVFGKFSEYRRGILNTTGIDYHKLKFTFNPDGSGSHFDQYGMEYPLNWRFTTKNLSSLELDVKGMTYDWQLFAINGDYLYSSVNLTIYNDRNNLETFRLIRINTKQQEPCDSLYVTNASQ